MPETRRADRYERIIVVFNACREDQAIRDDALKGTTWSLHPIQVDSCDERVCQSRFEPQNGVFQVSGRTTAVFVNGDDWGELV
jgi:hypothetical protein